MNKISWFFIVCFSVNLHAEWRYLHGVQAFSNANPHAKLSSLPLSRISADDNFIYCIVSTNTLGNTISLTNFLRFKGFSASSRMAGVKIQIFRPGINRTDALIDALDEFESIEPPSIIAHMKEQIALFISGTALTPQQQSTRTQTDIILATALMSLNTMVDPAQRVRWQYRQEQREKVEMLLKTNDRLDHIEDKNSPLLQGYIYEYPDLLRRLIAKGLKVDAKESFSNRTSLYEAISANSLPCTSILLEAGANPNHKTNHRIFDESPLECAVKQGHIDIIRLLLKYGADARIINEAGESLIVIALKDGFGVSLDKNRLDIIKELIKHGADPLQRDKNGRGAEQRVQEAYDRWNETPNFPKQAASLKMTLDFLKQATKPPFTCTICLDEKHARDATMLGCGHLFCNDCLKDSLDIAWQHQTDPAHQTCPHKSCAYEWQEADVRAFTHKNQAALHKFDVMKLRRCIHKSPNLQLCPGVDCDFIYEITDGSLREKLTCPRPGCGKSFCSHCQATHHPALISCEEASRIANMSKSDGEKLSDEWTLQQTKPCPSCHTRIQKNAGCQYIKCTHCQELFCWKCNAIFGKELTGHPGSLPSGHGWH